MGKKKQHASGEMEQTS